MADSKTHILYCVLNWGLGHATRSIPVIQSLLDKGVKVSIAGEGDSFFLLQQNFPDLDAYELKGIKVQYPKKGSMVLQMLRELPSYLKAIRKEHKQTEELINRINPDAIISDNRYGCYSKNLPSVFITHQLRIQAPDGLKWMEPLIYFMNKKYIRRFSELWVPDNENEKNLTGILAHHPECIKKLKPKYIGPLSRFANTKSSAIHERYEMVIILSGPEPQRGILEELCKKQAIDLPYKTLIVRGLPQQNEKSIFNNITFIDHCSSADLKAYMEQADFIVSRSGHSTLMDLSYLGKAALCIPTPGQTEQEYLGKHLGERGYFISQNQSDFNLKKGIALLKNCKVFPKPSIHLLEPVLNRFLQGLSRTN